MMNTRSSAVLAMLFFSACASVSKTTMVQAQAKPDDCKLDIYASENDVKRSHEALCMLSSETATNAFTDKSVNAAMDLAKSDACKCGGDAMVLLSGGRAGDFGRGKALIKVIRYTE